MVEPFAAEIWEEREREGWTEKGWTEKGWTERVSSVVVYEGVDREGKRKRGREIARHIVCVSRTGSFQKPIQYRMC